MTGVEITLRDVYDSQQASRTEVAQLSAQVTQLSATVNLQLAAGNARMDDHENRLRAVEKDPKVTREEHRELEERTERLEGFQGRVIGIGLSLMFLGAIIAAAVGALITHALGK